ncbi:hypothetical protein GGTG_03888 [Gaeumannomyces tritici R3-111a-1]|uniref:AB hydrolase-1 domain-containing protein n=1 Tax=Gaeumannomyces tritici (strain R3-111a-1) TaxID=644352 RepID=J3NRI4_GAET3|nr:hypothetical protein GGTG_03888 [Gaeumannomyces tritici R3-111a-1]EJT78790.1 hypothetical protein GGTG_03888 [Gaeumannomyces tritici R3-111a-1]
MKKTLLLCFIHGFKGGEDTFGTGFPEHLRQLVAEELPKVDVRVVVYPKYETRGDLAECVDRFRDWLLEKVIDIEVNSGTPSPTIDPSVRTILIGHSMGGIVAAETVMALTSERPIQPAGSAKTAAATAAADAARRPTSPSLTSLMFPYVQGLLAFDTPFLGISPGVKKKNAAAAAGADGGGAWGRWGKVAMFAGAGAALAVGGAAAYMNREQITQGLGWASSHLEFVGCLARGEELKRRVAYLSRARSELGVGFGNLYTRLGKAAPSKQVSMAGTVVGNKRTFCNLPAKAAAGTWLEAVNDAATDETLAHTTMFEPAQNPGYEKLAHDAAGLISSWTRNEWYDSSAEQPDLLM